MYRKQPARCRLLADGGTMSRAICPACLGSIQIDDEQATMYEQVRCPHCDALLEVVDELPLTLEEVE